MPIPFMTSGYTRTGKDTLHTDLKEGLIKYTPLGMVSVISMMWNFYKSNKAYLVLSSKNVKIDDTIKAFSSRSRGHQPLAKKLKDDVHEMLNLSSESPEKIAKFKDVTSETGLTLRDYYIEHGRAMRKSNVNHWVEETYRAITKSNDEYVDITDYRFPNESKYIKDKCPDAVTCRIYRSSVPIPATNIPSEHSLDKTSTDYLLVDGVISLMYSAYYFPQYLGTHRIDGFLTDTNVDGPFLKHGFT
jgi:hypothetical protein